MKMGIYQIRNIANGKLYVGSSHNIDVRFYTHKERLRKGRHHSIKLQRAWNKWGEESFEFSVIEAVHDTAFLLIREQYWMDLLKVAKEGYNILPKAGTTLGVKRRPETIAKMSESNKKAFAGRPFTGQRFDGTLFTEEHRRKISEGNKGKIVTQETREKIRQTLLGKKHTDERRKNQSLARIKYFERIRSEQSC